MFVIKQIIKKVINEFADVVVNFIGMHFNEMLKMQNFSIGSVESSTRVKRSKRHLKPNAFCTHFETNHVTIWLVRVIAYLY